MSSGCVLVVEDDPDVREALLDALQEHGFTPTGASNGREALEILRRSEERPRVIFLDLMMPSMDGREFREEQLRRPELADIPVVVISAYRDVAERAAALSAADHLRKPMNVADLLRLARRFCQGAG